MIKTGYVVEANEKTAKIRIYRESACGENCAHCGGCKNGETIVVAENTAEVKTGETVRIIMDNKSFFKNAFIGYGILVIALILGAVLGYVIFGSDLASGIGAFAFLGLTLLLYRFGFAKSKPDIKIERI